MAYSWGTVYKGERLEEATRRIVKKETGLEVDLIKHVGYIEYLNEKRFGRDTYSISLIFEAVPKGGELNHDNNATELKYFKELPNDLIEEQREFIKTLNFS